MNMIWWLLPAVSGLIGLMLTFGGLGKLFKLKPFSGGARLLTGFGFLGLAGVVSLAGLNLQTYKRLTFERPVAVLTFTQSDTPDGYIVNMVYPGGEQAVVELTGDEWELNARVVKFKAFSNLLGFDSVYKLDRVYGRYTDVARASETNGKKLSTNPGLDVVAMAIDNGGKFGVEDARYGSAVYNPMADGLSFIVCMTQAGLIARPNNRAAAQSVGSAYQPNNGCAKTAQTIADAALNAPIGVQGDNPLPSPEQADDAATDTGQQP